MLLKFRRLLETHEFTHKIVDTLSGHLAAQGLMPREGRKLTLRDSLAVGKYCISRQLGILCICFVPHVSVNFEKASFMKVNIPIIVIIIALVSTSLWLTSEEAPPVETQVNFSESLPIPSFENRVVKIDDNDEYVCSEDPGGRIAPSELKLSKSLTQAIEKRVIEGYAKPETLVQEVRNGHGISSIAAYQIISSCFSLKQTSIANEQKAGGALTSTRNGCPSMPGDFVSAPLKILELAAEKGSTEAALAYATNGISFAQYYRNQNASASLANAQEIIDNARKYGDFAARSGMIEALAFMSRAYQVGLFGEKNPTLAYAYFLPLASGKQPNDVVAFAESLRRNLTEMQQAEARAIAFGCAKASGNDMLRNPFG